MPQIKDQAHFKQHLETLGIFYSTRYVGVDQITPVQVDIDQAKVQSIDPSKPSAPIIVSDAFYILDGHHRYFSHMFYDMDEIEVIQVDTGINKLLALANDYVEQGAFDDS